MVDMAISLGFSIISLVLQYLRDAGVSEEVIDANWEATKMKGKGGLTLYNMSDSAIMIEQGKRIAQMVIFKADAASQYDGHYNDSDSVESKRIKEWNKCKTLNK